MQQYIKKHARLLMFSMTSSCISSMSLLLCIFAVKSDSPIYFFVIPIIFWLGLIAEQLSFWIANSVLKKIITEEKPRRIHNNFGIISLMQTDLGSIADIVFVASLVIFIILALGGWGKQVFQFIFLFLMVLSFRIHCIANGKNYWYKKYFRIGEGK